VLARPIKKLLVGIAEHDVAAVADDSLRQDVLLSLLTPSYRFRW
jgi:hypothetical protein